MGTGTAIALWLSLLAAGQTPASDISYMNDRKFEIPITLPNDPAFQAEIDQLFLFVSTDEGKTWRQEIVASPRDKHFEFFARTDGSYWFNVSVQDKMKRSYPPDITAVAPALKVVVDTRKPAVKFVQTERLGDQVTVAWDIRDENIDLAACQLEYSTSEAPTPYMVPITPSVSGQKSWTVKTPGKITVRMTVKDLAENVAVATAELGNEPPAALALAAGPPPPAAAVTNNRPPAAPAESPFPANNWQKNPVPNEPPALPRDNPALRTNEPPRMSAHGVTPAMEEVTLPRVIATSKMPASTPAWSAAQNQVTPASVPPAPAAMPPRTKPTGPPMQYSNQLHLDLNYEAKAGPSGVGEVQLWMTPDDGRTWRRFAEDADLESPFGVDVPAEGTYGFSLVIRSKGGIYKGNKQAPLPGDVPELRVEVDCTAPEAEMYAVEADPRRKDMLFLQWKASDRNLAVKPITLKWAEKPDGPWQMIATEIPNTGRHEWSMPANLPYRIFLRMEVKDLAGNVCVAETDQPVLVDLVEPDGGITGIVTTVSKKPD